jgi:AGZA family xanthine/uracil permease-like MFS transporter
MVTLGNLSDKNTLLAIFGLMFIAALLAWRVRAAMLIGILATTLVGAVFGLVTWSPGTYHVSDIAATAGKLDIRAAWNIGLAEIVFVFLFVFVLVPVVMHSDVHTHPRVYTALPVGDSCR